MTSAKVGRLCLNLEKATARTPDLCFASPSSSWIHDVHGVFRSLQDVAQVGIARSSAECHFTPRRLSEGELHPAGLHKESADT